MKKSGDTSKKQAEQDFTRINKSYRSTSSNSNFNSDSQTIYNSRTKKKGDDKAVVLGINTPSNKNLLKDGTYKIHHYRADYDPELLVETSQIIIKRKDQLIALDKYIFGSVPNKREKKVSIVGVINENPQSNQITNHRHRVKNLNPKPNQITATAVLTPDGLYQQISSTDAEYVTVDSSVPIESNESKANTIQRQIKVKPDSSMESSDIFKKNLSPTKSIQAEIESSFVDSNTGISPRNPHGNWKKPPQNEAIEEIEYEYVTVDEEEERNEGENIKKREVSFDLPSLNNNNNNHNRINNQKVDEQEIEYEIIEEEEEEEEAEFELPTNSQNQNKMISQEEEEEYEYITVEEEEEEENENNIIPSNSLGDIQPLNVFQKNQEQNINKKPNIPNTDYDEDNDYATTEDNINTQSFINSEQNKTKNEEEENEIEQKSSVNNYKNQNEGSNESRNERQSHNSNIIQSDKSIEKSISGNNNNNDGNEEGNQSTSNQNIEYTKPPTIECNNKSENHLESIISTNNKETNIANKYEKKTKFVNNESTLNESINVNDIQFSTANQFDQKESEPTVSIFDEYVFADENKKKFEEEQKTNLKIATNNNHNINNNERSSKINDSSFAFNNSQIQKKDEKQISNTLTNLVTNRNQILKSEIESTSININIVDDFDQKNDQEDQSSNLNSPSRTVKKLYLSPSNAVESRAGNTQNENSKIIHRNEPSIIENEKNKTKLKSQFEFENPQISNHLESDDASDKANGVTNDQTIATCDLDMSNIQKSPPAKVNQNQNQNNNSDDYYSHEYYTTIDTKDQTTNNQKSKNKNQNSRQNKDNHKNSKKNNKRNNNDSYYSYSYYSDTYTYSTEPSTIESKSRRSRQHHRRHKTDRTYEYITNATYETMDREVRPVKNRNNKQLPIELQQQILQQLQQQLQQNPNNSSNQSTPIRLRVKDSQINMLGRDNEKPPRFILRTVSENGRSTPHDIQLVLESNPTSSQQTPMTSTRTSTATATSQNSVPTSPTQSISHHHEIPHIIESGPHKGLIKRRIKKSEKAKRDSERLMQVEQDIKNLEQKIIEQDEKKQNLVDTSVEITTSYTDHNDKPNSIFGTSSRGRGNGRGARGNRGGRGKRAMRGRGANRDVDISNSPKKQSNSATASRSSKAAPSSSTTSPNKRHYYDENGNPALVELSDSTGRPVFRRIVNKSSASSSIKQGKSNPNLKTGSQSLPRPIRTRRAISDNEQQNQPRKPLFRTPNKYKNQPPPNNNSIEDDDIEKVPLRVSIPKPTDIINRNIEVDSEEEEDDIIKFNKENAAKQAEFGEIFRSRKAPHIKRAKFQNPQIYIRHRDGNSSSGSTPSKKSAFDSDSDSESLDSENPFSVEPNNMSPSTRRKKREKLEQEIAQLRQLLPDNKEEIERYSSKKKFTNNSPSIPSSDLPNNSPKRFVNVDENENDQFSDYDANFKNLQRSPYEQEQNNNINNNVRNRAPFQLNMNQKQGQRSDGSAYSLTERRKIPKITVEIPSKGNAGQADVFRRHYENASPEKASRKGPDRYRDFNEYDIDDSVPLNASTKNTFKNLEEEKEAKGNASDSSNLSSKKKSRRRIRVSLHDGSRSPAPHSSNSLKDSQQQSSNHSSNANSPSGKQRENIGEKIKPFIDSLKALKSSSDDENVDSDDQQNDDPDSIGAMNPVQAMKAEERNQKIKQKDIMPLTPPADVDINSTSSMLSNAPPPSPKNQDVEIVYRNGKRKRKKKVPISPSKSGSHSHSSRSSKNSGTRGNVIRSHHLKDSEKYQVDSPPPSMLSSIVNNDENEEEENSTFIQDV